jgi:hypothetical protein
MSTTSSPLSENTNNTSDNKNKNKNKQPLSSSSSSQTLGHVFLSLFLLLWIGPISTCFLIAGLCSVYGVTNTLLEMQIFMKNLVEECYPLSHKISNLSIRNECTNLYQYVTKICDNVSKQINKKPS